MTMIICIGVYLHLQGEALECDAVGEGRGVGNGVELENGIARDRQFLKRLLKLI